MKRNIFCFLLLVLALFFLCSCQKSSGPEVPTPVPTAAYSDFISVPAGTFAQNDGGSSFSHTITAFSIGKHEITYEIWYETLQWAASNGYVFGNAGREGDTGTDGAAPTAAKYQPVVNINWRDAMIWCNAHSQKNGKTPVYFSDAGFTIPLKNSTDGSYGASIDTASGSFDTPYVNWSSNGYRLPTEGEWQYAASYINGSGWTPYNYASGATADYTDATATSLVAYYSDNSDGLSQTVGNKLPNALLIYDMSGNVWEWVWDWSSAYPGASTDYTGPATGILRMLRGGSSGNSASQVIVGYRNGGEPYAESTGIGLRLAKKP